MRLQRLGTPAAPLPVVRDNAGTTYDLRPVTADVDAAFFAADGLDRTRSALAAGELPSLDPAGLGVLAPIAQPPTVVCVGMNYAAHAAESGDLPPTELVFFLKKPNSVVGPYDDVLMPRSADRLDWEVELGVVIGRACDHVEDDSTALAAVAGYVLVNDVSERRFQLEGSGGQWSKGKCCPTFSPLGPWLATADEVDPTAVPLRSWINGDPRQDSTTADMIFGVAETIRTLSRYMTLEPGDLVLTGTPQGVALSGRFPYLVPGDEIRMQGGGLGEIRQRVVA
ncbi:MAG: fumarylacetoacetate hydrolase family protein [Nocardioidaceae bacterium]|nr:fumarylacetoacetate hydrolase family protein [Nocardioidaceae bacterium]